MLYNHMVAAMCAICSQGIAIQSHLDIYHHNMRLITTKKGKPSFNPKHTGTNDYDPTLPMMKTARDYENVIKIIVLARAFQILLRHLKLSVDVNSNVRFLELIGGAPSLLEGK